MPTIDEHATALDRLVDLARGDLRSLFDQLDAGDARALTSALLAALPAIAERYGDVAAVLAGDLYDELRSLRLPNAPRYRALLAPPAPAEQVEAFTRWAVGPVWSTTPDPAQALRQLEGGLTRLVLQPGRRTTIEAAAADPVRVGVARVPRGSAPCPWCLMLASRGAVYVSEQSASRRSSDLGRYHDDCHCEARSIFDVDQDLPDINRRLADEWQSVVGIRSGSDARLAWARHVEAAAMAAPG